MPDSINRSLVKMATVFYGCLFLCWLAAAVLLVTNGIVPHAAPFLWTVFLLYPLGTLVAFAASRFWQQRGHGRAAFAVLLFPFFIVLVTIAALLARVGALPLPGDQLSGCYYAADRQIRVQYYAAVDETAVRQREIHVVEGADVRSFDPFPHTGDCGADAEFYGRDNRHVYRRTDIVPQADPATFELLPAGYVRDASHVYYFNGSRHIVVAGADPATFVIDEEGTALDATYFYEAGQPISK